MVDDAGLVGLVGRDDMDGMQDYFQAGPRCLPQAIYQLNILTVYIVYVTVLFGISLVVRLRFYRAVFQIALYVRQSCPQVFKLLEEHWTLCVRDGVVIRVLFYLAVLLPYWGMTRFIFPQAVIGLDDLARIHASAPALIILLFGMMGGLDFYLVGQVSMIDSRRIIGDLQYAESWLGGSVNRWLDVLGSWNPLRRYANNLAKQNMLWFNEVFRNSMSILIFQTLVRLGVGAVLFAAIGRLPAA